MSTWPQLKTARDLCAERILPCSEDMIRDLAKAHGIGRKLGRTLDPRQIHALPRPAARQMPLWP